MKTIVQLVQELHNYFIGKDTTAKQAVEANIAPVETDATSASQAYAIGKQLILIDVLYDVTAAITQGDALVVGTNIVAADNLTDQIAAKADISDLGSASAKDSTNAVTQSSTDLVESGAVYTALTGKANAPTIKTETLAASATSVTFTGMPTTGNNIISFYIDGGANYTAIDTSTSGQVTLTYDAESSARTVYCEIEGVS